MADNSLSRSQQLLADMDAKYGKTSSSAPVEPVAPPPVQPAPQPAAKKPGGMLEGAMNLIGNRNKQIDKAAGYACGGKVKAHAKGGKVDAVGKISGPGTATSDSIPAKISPTGEDILVANGERIISVEQDQLLERIAQMLGFETVDAMFEQMTGKPVGPSMKDGMMAAADGWGTNNVVEDEYTIAMRKLRGQQPDSSVATGAIDPRQPAPVPQGALYKDPATAIGSAIGKSMASSDSATNEIKGLYPAGTFDNQGPQSVTSPASTQAVKPSLGVQTQAQSPTPAQPVQRGRDANGVITAESAKAFQDSGGLAGMKSGSFYGTADLAGQNDRIAKSLGYASADDFNQKQKDFKGYGPGILGDESRGINGQDAANAEKTQRWRNDELLANANRGNQGAIAALLNADSHRDVAAMGNETSRQNASLAAQVANSRDQVTAAGDILRYGNPLDSREKQLKVAGLEDMAGLRGKALAGDPKAVSMINALSGKNYDKDRYHNLPNRKVYNEMGQVIDEVPGGLFDTQTGQMVQAGAAQKPKQFTAGQTYTDANGNKAIYQKDGTWKEVK